MHEPVSPALASAALRNAFPYLRLFQDEVFVVKAGGEAFLDPANRAALLEQLSILHRLRIHVVLVHGGGPQIDALGDRLGLDPRFEAGRRVTCPQTLQTAVMALNGTVNTEIVAALRALDTPAIGISGIDGGLLTAERRPPVTLDGGARVDYGCVGDLVDARPEFLRKLIEDGLLPVVSPLCADGDGNVLNVNADGVASRLAAELGAAKLIFATAAPGILTDPSDPGTLVSFTDLPGLAELGERGALQGGMLPKVAAIRDAVEGGVARVHVISHRAPDSILVEVFTNEGAGTLVVPEIAALSPEESAS